MKCWAMWRKQITVTHTSLFCFKLHRVAFWTLKLSVSHDHVGLVFAVRIEFSEDTRGMFGRCVETFVQLCPVHFQALNQTGLPQVVQLRKRGTMLVSSVIGSETKHINDCLLTLYSLNSPFTLLGSTGTQWTFTLVLLIFDTLRFVGAADGSKDTKRMSAPPNGTDTDVSLHMKS